MYTERHPGGDEQSYPGEEGEPNAYTLTSYPKFWRFGSDDVPFQLGDF